MTRTRTLQPYLRHIHLPSDAASATFPTYCVAAAIQARLQRAQLDFKAAPSSPDSSPPPPTLVTFTPTPTYTLGRRQHSSSHGKPTSPPSLPTPSSRFLILPSELQALARPLHLQHATPSPPPSYDDPVVLRTERGGLTTYHGPGQLVMWPVIDLKGGGSGNLPSPTTTTIKHTGSRRHRPFGVRQYAELLQDVTAVVLARLWGLAGTTTCDPGVWVAGRKVAAMGVHLRRHVTGLGVALNLSTPVTSPGDGGGGSPVAATDAELLASNPWLRFVPCGLEGKHVTSVAEELRLGGRSGCGPDPLDPADAGRAVATAWADEFAARIIGGSSTVDADAGPAVQTVGDDEVQQLVADVADEARLIEEESRLWPARPDLDSART
ncbi:hypothetical protein GGTG_12098 [Gaeumannomyces tritici R3-111a-1]|uniref:BPL/LPL catalytic domain-containing protein n=1 Tax=Gaeumannomyces tritici (strain R3-111a-1) TaxID=644352 RepID=J3PF19_GAET3|nr:hypothetical protein GGTG_12098 [Gaeumannomyces tritici R3-111a-1]EJT71077.1 hypothetical protein GGTG_12098 [Gaeumannomyces tritici R3-111a-1]